MSDIPITNTMAKHIFCNRCANETRHICKADHYRDYPNINPDGSLGIIERLGYRLWICAGCERGTLGEYYIFDVTDEGYEKTIEEEFLPERTMFHVKDKSFKQLPNRLKAIYREILQAYNNKLEILCAIGIRALLEGICADKDIKGKNLETKINNMTTIIPQNIVNHLHNIRFIGNEAAHALTGATTEELRLTIEICEDLLNYLYELDYKASRLSRSRLSRASKTSSSTISESITESHL